MGNAEQARKVIAMFDAGVANTAENDPKACMRALLGVSLGQKPWQWPQMMGMLSAADINTDSSAKARERVDALNQQASAGMSAKLGRRARLPCSRATWGGVDGVRDADEHERGQLCSRRNRLL